MALACLVAEGAQKDEGPGSSLVALAAASVCRATDHTISFLDSHLYSKIWALHHHF